MLGLLRGAASTAAWRGVGWRRELCAAVKAGRHQTPIVDSLWRKRSELKARDAHVMDDSPGERSLVPKTPEASENSMTYAFSSDEALADTYSNPWGHVRVGRLLEDLDALAGTIAFEHCRIAGEDPLLLVTASVDRIAYRHRPNLKDDIVMGEERWVSLECVAPLTLTLSPSPSHLRPHPGGCVTWVGRSSMEIGMHATSAWADAPFLEATFTFVARDPATNRSASINPLHVTGERALGRTLTLALILPPTLAPYH